MLLKDKVAVITGAGKGMGKAIACRFAIEGAKVVVNDMNSELGNEVVKIIKKQGGEAVFIQGDVGIKDDIKKLFEQTRSTFGMVEILVNNAGIFEMVPFNEMSEEQWDKMFQVNLKGTFYCCKYAVDQMLSMKKGIILNMTSIAAKTGGTLPCAHYAASKAAVFTLTKSLATELVSSGIRVNGVAPGTIKTDMTSAISDKKIAEIPMGRLGEPEEVANAVAFMCSNEASYITGEILDLNGGQYMD